MNKYWIVIMVDSLCGNIERNITDINKKMINRKLKNKVSSF